jgi:peptide/nickel transport system permease protein
MIKRRIKIRWIAAVTGLLILFCLALTGFPQNPYNLGALSLNNSLLPPGTATTQMVFWLGSDLQGRDVLSAMVYGLYTSLWICLVSSAIALLLGVFLGLTAAYRGGWVEQVVLRLVDLKLAVPTLLVALLLHMILGPSALTVIIALSLSGWAYYARTIRSVALEQLSQDYVKSARCLNASWFTLIFKVLLPNCLTPLFIVITYRFAHCLMVEASLSFLGLGMPLSTPSLGVLVNRGADYLLTGHYWLSLFPGLTLTLLLIGINTYGDHLSRKFNPSIHIFK